MAEAEAGKAAIRRALRSLRRRHLVEEGAHRPAIEALTRPFAAHVIPTSTPSLILQVYLCLFNRISPV